MDCTVERVFYGKYDILIQLYLILVGRLSEQTRGSISRSLRKTYVHVNFIDSHIPKYYECFMKWTPGYLYHPILKFTCLRQQ